MISWFIAFVIVNILDAALTLYGLKLGASELNPVLRFLMKKLPAPVAILSIKGIVLIGMWMSLSSVAVALPWLVLAFSLVCVWNIWQIIKMRKNAS